MDVKRFIRLTHFKYIGFILLPLIFGMVYSFYKFDMIRFGVMVLFVTAVITSIFGLLLLKALMDYRYEEEEGQSLIEKLEIDLDKLRQWMWSSLGVSFILVGVITLLTTVRVLYVFIILFLISLLCVAGKYALIKTALSEFTVSILLGFGLPLLTIYTNVFNEQPQFFSLFMEVLLVSTPFILSFFILFIGYHLIERNQDEVVSPTMTSLMSEGVADGIMELFLFLAYILPLFYIYMDYTSWTMLLLWVVFPKLWWNLKHFERTYYEPKHFLLIREIASTTMEMQILLYMLGLFF